MYRMSTAWSDPRPVFEKLKEMFPSLTIKVYVYNEVDPPYSYTAGSEVWTAERKRLEELVEQIRQCIGTPPSQPREDVKPATIESANQFVKESSVSVPRQKRQSIETPPSPARKDVKYATIEDARQFMKRTSVSVPEESTPPAAPQPNAGQNAPGMNNEGTTQK